jgi:hypothetical protein
VTAFEPAKGRLLLAERALAVLVAHTADPVAAATEDGAPEQLRELAAAGVIEGGRAHPAIADALAAIVSPDLCTLELAHSGKAMRGWVSYSGAALLLPAGDDEEECRTLLSVHPTLLPEAVARFVELGPRPRAAVAAPVAPEDPAVGTIRRRWRLSAAWTLDDGTAGGGALEILDAEHGLWLLHPGEGEDTLAWPVTPTFVWRHVVRLLMRRPADPVG